ncbi:MULTISPECIES: SH3 domain-containing protein [unclassified Streptomyces]|uniref:SH3 domain-containing protein n=1 Tax=unclassified Streptomyces TaxID=2593676 RepID=UPI001318DD05|nr:SH3 domain-containing protein [Streptomyces sp. GS7]QHC22355.1 SH3 domain-containing protein [Streptomyces sp. GS7]
MSTTDVFVVRGQKLAAGAGALTMVVALGATLLAAAPAQATPQPKPQSQSQPQPQSPSDLGGPYGTVTAARGISERMAPSTDAPTKGFLRNREGLVLECKVRAQGIRGNDVWFRVHGHGWVSGKYVTNNGYVRYCKDVQRTTGRDSDGARRAG